MKHFKKERRQNFHRTSVIQSNLEYLTAPSAEYINSNSRQKILKFPSERQGFFRLINFSENGRHCANNIANRNLMMIKLWSWSRRFVEDKQIKSMRSYICSGKRGLLCEGARTMAWVLPANAEKLKCFYQLILFFLHK